MATAGGSVCGCEPDQPDLENVCGDEKCMDCPEQPPKGMEPIDYWATGRPDWGHLSGLTGTRPIVDRYSITRFSPNEWHQRNNDIIERANSIVQKSIICKSDAKKTISKAYMESDQSQHKSTNLLATRTRDVDQWRGTLNRAISAQMEEISLLEEQRQRLKKAILVLQKPESIASECLDRRLSRPDTELIRDGPEDELIKEMALIDEIRQIFLKVLKDIEEQQNLNRTTKNRMEHDWSNKKDAFEIETVNCGLGNRSMSTLFKPGATRCPEEQSTEEYWEHFTKEALDDSENLRQKSIQLRSTLNSILMNCARDLRNQADRVERAFQDRINCMDAVRVKLEIDLKECLRRIADTEELIHNLKVAIRSMDNPMRAAQTRLDNRNHRLQVENCRDKSQYCLIQEVSVIQTETSEMEQRLKDAEAVLEQLLQSKVDLETEILMKRKTIGIDKERCQAIRNQFPSTTAMSGFLDLYAPF